MVSAQTGRVTALLMQECLGGGNRGPEHCGWCLALWEVDNLRQKLAAAEKAEQDHLYTLRLAHCFLREYRDDTEGATHAKRVIENAVFAIDGEPGDDLAKKESEKPPRLLLDCEVCGEVIDATKHGLRFHASLEHGAHARHGKCPESGEPEPAG